MEGIKVAHKRSKKARKYRKYESPSGRRRLFDINHTESNLKPPFIDNNDIKNELCCRNKKCEHNCLLKRSVEFKDTWKRAQLDDDALVDLANCGSVDALRVALYANRQSFMHDMGSRFSNAQIIKIECKKCTDIFTCEYCQGIIDKDAVTGDISLCSMVDEQLIKKRSKLDSVYNAKRL